MEEEPGKLHTKSAGDGPGEGLYVSMSEVEAPVSYRGRWRRALLSP